MATVLQNLRCRRVLQARAQGCRPHPRHAVHQRRHPRGHRFERRLFERRLSAR